MRLLKWVSLGLGALVALVVLGVLVIVWLVDPNSFKSNIEARVRDATGRDFTLAGDIELGFFPWLALRTGEGSFGNAPGFGSEPMVSWKGAQIGAKVFPLLRGELVADRVILEGADLRLVRRADGSANWQNLGGDKPADPNAKPLTPHIDGVQIEDSRVLFIDETVPRRVEVTGLDLTTGYIGSGKPFTDTEIAGVLHMDGFAPQGVPFRVEVPEVVLPEDFSSVQVKEFSVAFGGFEADGAVNGTLGDAPKLEGKIATNEFDPRALLTSVGVAPPKTTDAQALGKLRFAGSWNFDGGAIGIDPFTLVFDDTHFSGSFHRSAGDNPVGEFALRGDTLDISRYIPPTDPASAPFVLPTAMLKALMFRGSVELERATLDDIDMKGVTLRLLLDDKGLRSEAKTAWGRAMKARARGIAPRLLAWHAKAGRHDLPWQKHLQSEGSAYRVWVSEIMLQQTQVATVIPYFDRFMQRFPDVIALANAPADEVLHLWTGLGYYARARNLHRAAQLIRDRHHGKFPEGLDAVMELPGVGRSTAGAILALSAGARHSILDANVKRVLARYYAIDGAPDEAATLAQLWKLADDNTPATDVATYTQAIMDLGAMVCRYPRPRCEDCPIAADCRARIEGRQAEIPAVKRKRAVRRTKTAVMLVARRASQVLLVQRPPSGIWGGLWCLPEFEHRDAAEAFAQVSLTSATLARAPLPDIEHSFTHFDLVITPVVARCRGESRVRDGNALWYDLTQPARVGLPAPIKTLLGTLLERNES